MTSMLNRWLWLWLILCVCSSTHAAENDAGVTDKNPVISIELGQITYNGQPLPMWAKASVWEKVLGKASYSDPEAGIYTWGELGLFCSSGYTIDGVVELTINLVEISDYRYKPRYWPSKPFSGTLYIDGAHVTPDSSIREINRHKTIGPPLKERGLPSNFGYEINAPSRTLVWLTRQGNVIRDVVVNRSDNHLRDTPNAAKDITVSKNTIAPTRHHAAKQRLPEAPRPAKQTAPITSADIQRVLAEVKEASQGKFAGSYVNLLSSDADIRRNGMIETRGELIQSAREFFYSVTDYQYEQIVESIDLAPDGQQATIQLTIRERYSEGSRKNIEDMSKQRWLLERVDGRVMVTELTIQQ